MHSGISKVNGHKVYHPYLSSDRNHDQQIVAVAINTIINQSTTLYEPETAPDIILIESDNAFQYKFVQHFHEIQKTCNRVNKPILRVYGIAQHGKGEVDHVGGIAKNVLRKAIAEGHFFQNIGQMADYLHNKFSCHTHPEYHVELIDEEDIKAARSSSSKHTYGRLDGASAYQIVVFTPNSETIKSAPRICICEKCEINYGSCELFTEVKLPVMRAKASTLRSSRIQNTAGSLDGDRAEPSEEGDRFGRSAKQSTGEEARGGGVETIGEEARGGGVETTGEEAQGGGVEPTGEEAQGGGVCEEFLQPGTVCAVAAADNTSELMWFILITSQGVATANQGVATANIDDDYEHTIYEGERYLMGRYMEYHTETSKHKKYRVMDNSVFIRYESVLYPFVAHDLTGNMCKISMTEFSEILNYIDNSGMKYI